MTAVNAIPATTLHTGKDTFEIKTLREEISSLKNSIKDKFERSEAQKKEVNRHDIMNASKSVENKGKVSHINNAIAAVGGFLTGYAIAEISKNMAAEDNACTGEGNKSANKPVEARISYKYEDIIKSVKEGFKNENTKEETGIFKEFEMQNPNEFKTQSDIKKLDSRIQSHIQYLKEHDNDKNSVFNLWTGEQDLNREKGVVKLQFSLYPHERGTLTYNDKETVLIQSVIDKDLTAIKSNDWPRFRGDIDLDEINYKAVYIDNEAQTINKEIAVMNGKSYCAGYYIDKSTNTYHVWNAVE